MLTRQKIILGLLDEVGRPLEPTTFVKLVFVLRQETAIANESSFFDFVPYKRGRFSFGLYWELRALRQNGYVHPVEDRIELVDRTRALAREKANELAGRFRDAICEIVRQYGKMNQRSLMRSVYARYPWFATRSELAEARLANGRRAKAAPPAIYTAGYEGNSVDAFFNCLMKAGMRRIIDVRANPVSRKYGFSRLRLSEISKKLGFDYQHWPTLGIPSSMRARLSDFDSYQRLLDQYEHQMLPEHPDQIATVGSLLKQSPSVLICVEKDVRCCHRGRLAAAMSATTGLEVVHL